MLVHCPAMSNISSRIGEWNLDEGNCADKEGVVRPPISKRSHHRKNGGKRELVRKVGIGKRDQIGSHVFLGYQKQILQSRFLHHVACISRTIFIILPTTDYKSLHTGTVPQTISSLASIRVIQTFSPEIAAEEANLPHPYRTSLSQLHSYCCSSLHYYRDRIGLIPSPLCPYCGWKPPHLHPYFLLSFASNIPDLKVTMVTSTPDVSLPFDPPFFRSPASSSHF